MQKKKVIIIGAGASGLAAAVKAGEQGHQVLVLEKMNKPGKKILATGNGKCNLTNLYYDESCYRSTEPDFAKQVSHVKSPEDTMIFFRELGVYLKDKSGYIYPYSEQASTILGGLLYKLKSLNIPIILETKVLSIQKKEEIFYLKTNQDNYTADVVILATGGNAYEKLGSDGSGFALAKELGHKIIPPVPALTALKTKDKCCKQWAGVRIQGTIDLVIDGESSAKELGELQLTNYGVSGVPTFQVSRYASRALYDGKKVMAILDFMPEVEVQELEDLLVATAAGCPYKSIQELLEGILNWKLTIALLFPGKIEKDALCRSLSKGQISMIAHRIKHCELKITGTNDFDQAQVTCGGVSTREVDAVTMESNLVKNLYLTGELLDVDGTCGGYNLQWAFATGMIAGEKVGIT